MADPTPLTSDPSPVSPGADPEKAPPAFKDDLTLGPLPRKSVWSSIREELRARWHPEPLPPLELQSKPVPVDEIWSKPQGFWGRGGSLLIHAIVIALLLLPIFHPAVRKEISSAIPIVLDVPLLTHADRRPIAGGGGSHNRIPVTKGKLPEFKKLPLAPPMIKPLPQPKLAVPPAINVQADVILPKINLPTFGSTTAPTGPPSLGNGQGGGLGPGNGTGLGPGSGFNSGGGAGAVGGAVTPPQVTYDPSPEYSDEARKAKYQGTVVLQVEIGVDGMAHDIVVVQPLGLGLDEKAIEAVKLWRFTPARARDGKPIAMLADIQVNFRLY